MTRAALVIVLLVLIGGLYVIERDDSQNELLQDNEERSNDENAETKEEPRAGMTVEADNNQTLNLSNQGLAKTPEYVFGRTALQALDLSNNNLDGALQAEIRHLQNLKSLDLSNNRFTGVPAEIGQLKNLETLNLSNNQLTGLPYELGNLTNLKQLDLRGNAYAKADLDVIKASLPISTVILTD